MYTAKKVPVLPTPALQWTRIVPEKQVLKGEKGDLVTWVLIWLLDLFVLLQGVSLLNQIQKQPKNLPQYEISSAPWFMASSKWALVISGTGSAAAPAFCFSFSLLISISMLSLCFHNDVRPLLKTIHEGW